MTLDPAVGHGKPTLRNTRYLVESLLEYLAGGDSIEELLETFPDLEREDLLACLEYAVVLSKQRAGSMKFLEV
ncbi:MAG: DUF433 domain-containing protein [Cytophagaceae bacterium]|nr:DUF433 domain-containing protein [Cytophagaceae bacterium]